MSNDEEVLTASDWINNQRNSRPFFVSLAEVIRSHQELGAIVVGLGPGSYTGTRIAISAAMGLQMITGAELWGLPSVCAISKEKTYAVIGDAKRGSFFFLVVENGELAGAPELLSMADLRERIAQAGRPVYASDDLPQFADVKRQFPSAELLCRLPRTNAIRPPLTPIYLREPHITTGPSRHDCISLLG